MTSRKKRRMTSIILYLISLCLIFTPRVRAEEGALEKESVLIEAPSGVLMEASTGKIIFEKDGDTKRSPASITKIMTLILIFDALENGSLHLEDMVTTSVHAKSMGGSQVFLEEGEQQTVETLIKCIVIASGNDASVVMAEHIAGSEAEFVSQMNKRAEALGMKDTHFEDCCGLTDSQNHYTTAKDVAVMSRELITKYPKILDYSSIWMDTFTHTTRQGSNEFQLANTNKLIRGYDGCVGLKTGSTSLAKYCVSAVAKRKGVMLIAVVMAAPDYKVRFKDGAAMLNYGFSKCRVYLDENQDTLPDISVIHGKKEKIACRYEGKFRYLNCEGKEITGVEKQIQLPEKVTAPLQENDVVGIAEYCIDGKKIGEVRILAAEMVEKALFMDYLKKAFYMVF